MLSVQYALLKIRSDMPIPTDEVKYERDLKELKFYWEILNQVYYSTISRLHLLRHENPYFMSQMMYGINMATDSILTAYNKDSKVLICKHCKQLYIKDFPCLNNNKMPCDPIEYHKDMTFEDMYDYTSKKRG